MYVKKEIFFTYLIEILTNSYYLAYCFRALNTKLLSQILKFGIIVVKGGMPFWLEDNTTQYTCEGRGRVVHPLDS